MSGLIAALIVIGLFGLASAAVLYSYGSFARRARGRSSCAIAADRVETALDGMIAPLTEAHPGLTGMDLMPDNLSAFALRGLSARNAGRSLDLMYYYWKSDLTGALLALEVLRAADRGVRVRVLLDDISTRGDDRVYLAIDSHPNIELRLFNPARARTGAVRRALDLMLRAASATRRMHNKAWIADGRLAIVGGRNIGDAYFDAAEDANFSDMDLALVGPAVDEASRIFDAFWNSEAALPVRKLNFLRPNLPRLRRRLEALAQSESEGPYMSRIRSGHDTRHMLQDGSALSWTDRVRVLSDPPEKVAGNGEKDWLGRTILAAILGARSKVEIISPYFIPGPGGVEALGRLAGDGVDVAVSTNSLAATDVMAVHGAYARYRKPLIEAGIRLYELRPEIMSRDRRSLFGSSGASLHTKAFTVDGLAGFVGSFNFDPRSLSLNTEMGVLFEDEALTAEVSEVFARQISPQESYRVFLAADGGLAWEDGGAGGRIWRTEPLASIWRKLAAAIIGWLPIESQL